MKVKINKLKYEVKFVDNVGVNLLGSCDYEKQLILIKNGLSKEQTTQTLVHELTHGFMWAYGFAGVEIDEEIMCDFISIYGDEIFKIIDKILVQYKL